jgi:hypothetical protein
LTITNGTKHLGDTVAQIAKDDLVAAYNSAASTTLHGPSLEIPSNLNGQNLGPGVYHSADGTFYLPVDGVVTLDSDDPDGVYIFQTESTLIMNTNSTVVLAGEGPAQFCRVFWQVGSSATLGVNSHFAGHIFAYQSIQALTGATVQGQLLARNASVTLDTVTITNGPCGNSAYVNITKTAAPTSLVAGPGTVVFTYTVTNPGVTPLSAVSVWDDKLGAITAVNKGTDATPGTLDPGDVWVYTRSATLSRTTTNTAIASVTGSNASTATAAAAVTVSVATGQLTPPTATPWYNVLLAGVVLALLGAVGLVANRNHG